jgi:putative ABC transport system substrate-binding protein
MRRARRRFLLLAGALAATSAARGQARADVPTLGMLSFGRQPTPEAMAKSPFAAKLKSLGWAIGENLRIEYAYAHGQLERLPELAEGLVRKNVDVIWVVSPPAAVAAARATRTIPIVFVRVVWPIELGLGESFSRPGGNVTGVASIADPEILAKPVEYMLEVVRFKRGFALAPGTVIYKTVSGGTFSPAMHSAMDQAMERLGIERRVRFVESPRDIEAAFEDAAGFRAEALYVSSSPLLVAEMKRIVDFALRLRLPSGFIESQFVQAGGLLSYGSEVWGTIFQSLDYVDAILRGAKPAGLPIQLPKKLELAVNLKTAKELGVTVPQSLLLRADSVIA